jgi:hypothetical protein
MVVPLPDLPRARRPTDAVGAEENCDRARSWEPGRSGDRARHSSLGEQESAVAAREVCGGNIRISGRVTPWGRR